MKITIRSFVFAASILLLVACQSARNSELKNALSQELKQIDEFNRAENGDVESQFEVGLRFLHEGNYSLAKHWLELAMGNGSHQAMQSLGFMYEKGLFFDQDYSKALALYKQSAQANLPRSLRSVGVMYRDGLGVEKDREEALRWFQKSLDAGMPLSYADIGSLYIEGEGIEPNYSKAASYFQKGAELGEEWSLTALGLLYLEGKGVEKDTKKALSCFKRAAMRGNKIAQSRLAKLSEENNKR